jgi:small subunit ribosomal protein S9
MMAEEKSEQAQPVQPAQPAPQQPAQVVPAAKKQRVPRQKKPAKKPEKVIVLKSKRKEAVARASVKAGNGTIRINRMNVNTIEPREFKSAILEPINVSSITRELASRLSINVNVMGGGASAQAQAARGAIAKAMVAFADTDSIRKEYLRYDRFMLVDDTRRVEPKKFKGPKARARFQKSYR